MFSILQYAVKLVIKPIIFSSVARQPFVPHSLGVVFTLSPNYELNRTNRYWVIAIFVWMLHDVVTLTSDLFPQNWVSWQGDRDEYMCLYWSSKTFLWLKYKAINCRFSCPVARQPALSWQPFCTALVGRSSSRYPPTMNLTGPTGTELRHILATYIMCPCDLDLWPIFPKIGSSECWMYVPILKFIDILVLEIFDLKM